MFFFASVEAAMQKWMWREKMSSGALKHFHMPKIPDDLASSPSFKLKVMASTTMMIQITTVKIAKTVFAIWLGIFWLNDKEKAVFSFINLYSWISFNIEMQNAQWLMMIGKNITIQS